MADTNTEEQTTKPPQTPTITPTATTDSQKRFNQFLEGINTPGDSGNPPVPPPWLNKELFNRGRDFYKRYLFSVFLSDLVSLLALFSVGRILRPLIYTRKSDTPARALRRYVSTISRVMLWYSGDVWCEGDEARVDILRVRRVHGAVGKMFNGARQDEVHAVSGTSADAVSKGNTTTDHHEPPPPACPFHSPLKQDLEGQVKVKVKVEGEVVEEEVTLLLEARPEVYLSQWDMTFTQYCFMGVILAHPWGMGAWRVKEEELEGLLHFWRGCGWLLGIEDRYNFCSGTLDETRALCREMENRVVRPSLARAGRDTEHLGTALADGISSLLPWFSYPAILCLLGDTLGVKLACVWRRMSVREKAQYVFLRVLVHGLFLVPGVLWVFNEVLKFSLVYVQGKHARWRPREVVKGFDYGM